MLSNALSIVAQIMPFKIKTVGNIRKALCTDLALPAMVHSSWVNIDDLERMKALWRIVIQSGYHLTPLLQLEFLNGLKSLALSGEFDMEQPIGSIETKHTRQCVTIKIGTSWHLKIKLGKNNIIKEIQICTTSLTNRKRFMPLITLADSCVFNHVTGYKKRNHHSLNGISFTNWSWNTATGQQHATRVETGDNFLILGWSIDPNANTHANVFFWSNNGYFIDLAIYTNGVRRASKVIHNDKTFINWSCDADNNAAAQVLETKKGRFIGWQSTANRRMSADVWTKKTFQNIQINLYNWEDDGCIEKWASQSFTTASRP